MMTRSQPPRFDVSRSLCSTSRRPMPGRFATRLLDAITHVCRRPAAFIALGPEVEGLGRELAARVGVAASRELPSSSPRMRSLRRPHGARHRTGRRGHHADLFVFRDRRGASRGACATPVFVDVDPRDALRHRCLPRSERALAPSNARPSCPCASTVYARTWPTILTIAAKAERARHRGQPRRRSTPATTAASASTIGAARCFSLLPIERISARSAAAGSSRPTTERSRAS